MQDQIEHGRDLSLFDIDRHSEPLLTTAQLAKKMQVTPDSIRRWCSKNRRFPVYRMGGKNLYRLSEVLAYFQKKRG